MLEELEGEAGARGEQQRGRAEQSGQEPARQRGVGSRRPTEPGERTREAAHDTSPRLEAYREATRRLMMLLGSMMRWVFISMTWMPFMSASSSLTSVIASCGALSISGRNARSSPMACR